MDFVILVIGWVLGLVSPLLADRIKKPYRRKELLASIMVELKELRVKMAMVAYLMQTKTGNLDRSFLQWLKNSVADYDGPIEPSPPTDVLDRLAELDDAQLAALVAPRAANAVKKSLTFKKGAMPFTESRMHELSILPLELQRKLLDVRSHVELYNEDVDLAWSNIEKTFNPDMMAANKAAILGNITASYGYLATRAKDIADKITKILEDQP